jgi:plasmid stabilization system protein ParE
MSYAFHPEAETEFLESIAYYEECAPGLGLDFSAEVHSTIQRIQAFPKAWQILEDNIRRALVHRFPYGVLYALDDHDIWIVAIMNLHRQPEYWRDRLL